MTFADLSGLISKLCSFFLPLLSEGNISQFPKVAKLSCLQATVHALPSSGTLFQLFFILTLYLNSDASYSRKPSLTSQAGSGALLRTPTTQPCLL